MRKRNASRNNNTVPGFLSKTYKILENPEYAEIISWNEDGKAFKVKKPNEFAEKVLPKYFKTNNFASFVRQLNMYDFHKLRHDSEENEWRHRLFRRGYPNLLCEIKRKINETQIQDTVVSQKEQKKITSDTQYLLKEMVSLKQKQESLEKACGVLIAQNTQILGENKVLWGELNKKKEKAQKKIEKLFTLFLTYIGPKQIPELAFMNGKKPNEILQSQDYLKQEDLSDNDGDDDPRVIGGNHLGGATKRWDHNDIGNSLSGYPFINNNNNINNNHQNNLASSFNGGLNASNLLSSQNGGSGGQQLLPIIESGQNDQNVAQKLLDGLMQNLKNKQDGKSAMKQMNTPNAASGTQFNNFVDNYHKSNQDMLQNLQHFMNSQGGTQDLSSVDLNNQINQATMNPSQSTELLQKRQIKKYVNNSITNPFNTNATSSVMGKVTAEGFENGPDGIILANKKLKKNDDIFSSLMTGNNNNNNNNNNNSSSNLGQFGGQVTHSNINAAVGFNLDDFLTNQQLNQSNAFSGFDLAGGNNINRTSLGISKMFPNDFSTLALPQSTTVQPSSPTIKKPRSLNNISLAPGVGIDQQQSIVNVNKSISQSGLNDSLQSFNPNATQQQDSKNNKQQQQPSSQWEDFNKFLQDQKMEDSHHDQEGKNKSNGQNNHKNSTNSNNYANDNGNDEFITKDSVQKLNESIL